MRLCIRLPDAEALFYAFLYVYVQASAGDDCGTPGQDSAAVMIDME